MKIVNFEIISSKKIKNRKNNVKSKDKYKSENSSKNMLTFLLFVEKYP
jgi:hypothetical protein